MYDWNGNGKHDSFDDAMFMALLEDDLERHPPGKKTYRSSSSSSSSFFEEMGCMLYFWFLIFLPLALIVMFLFYGEWELVLLVVLIAVFVHIGLYKILVEPHSNDKKEKQKTQPKQASAEIKETQTSAPALQVFRYDNYDVLPERGGITIKKFVGVDKAVLEVPARLNNTPVRVIDTNAFYKCRYIEKLILPEGLNEIRDNIFNGCDNLKEVVIPKSVTKIGQDAFPHNKGLVLYCYGNSYGLEFARKNGFEYKDAEKMTASVQEVKVETASKPEVKEEPKSSSVSAQKQYSHSYKSDYIPVYTPSYTSGSVLDDEPEETVRERLDYDLIGTGYDSYDLEWMDEDERNQVLEDNFLDPYDYDFDDLD